MNPYEILQSMPALSLKAQEIKEKLKSEIVTGSAGAGLVQVSMTCALNVVGLKLDPKILSPSNIDTAEVLLAAAFNNAVEKARQKGAEIIGSDITFEPFWQRNQ